MKKKLTVWFERSVAGNKPETIEVVLTPLNTASDPAGNVTLVESKQVRKVKLTNLRTSVLFELTPTYDPGLTQPIFYRIAWRRGYIGRIFENDFAMPDYDVDFDDLGDLGHIITGENYLKEGDLGVPGRVARLNELGQVVDADGNPVSDDRVVGVEARLDQEVRDRISADALVRRDLTLRIDSQVSAVSNTIDTRIASERQARSEAIATEKAAREAADTQLNTRINGLGSGYDARFGTIETTLSGHTTALGRKADLVDGKVPTSQLPSIAIGTAVPVADETAMLALTRQQVQPGDFAVRPDGTFVLIADDPSREENWVALTGAGGVTSVNGQAGAVLLSAADVGARSVNQAIPQADVEGLVQALGGKASTSSVTSLDTRLTGQINTTNGNVTALTGRVGTLETNYTALNDVAVKRNAQGVIPTSYLDSDVPRVDADNVLRRKDGSIIAVGGGGSGTGAVDSVNGKVGTVVLTASDVNARPSGVPVPLAEVDSLSAVLAGKASTSDLTALTTRVGRAEADIDDLQAQIGGGGTGGGSFTTKTAITWVADDEANPSLVTMRSPFGIDAEGIPYYDPDGSAEGEAAYPYVSLYGNLVLRRLDPTAPPEPQWATVGDVTPLASRITALEERPSGGYEPPVGGIPISDMEQQVQDAFVRLQSATPNASGDTLVLRNAAGTFNIAAPTATTHPTTKSYVDEAVASKANAATVTALQSEVAGKASTNDLTLLTGRVTTAEGQLARKADLDTSSLVPIAQLPTLPGSKIVGFDTKADLDAPGGKLLLTQVPTGIPQANIDGLAGTLATKADLVSGKIPTSQIPSIALTEPHVVTSRSALLALTAAQVQRGDIGIITTGADQGSYILNAADPSVWANWVKLSFGGSGSVESVNGQTGIVVLNAADVGARPLGGAIAQSEVTNLVADLNGKASTTYVTEQVGTRTTPTDVTNLIVDRLPVKHIVDYVATAAVSLSGAQSIDGVLVPANRRVLLTAQASSSQNGIWVSQTGAWTRATDMPVGGTFVPGTLVAVRTGTNPGVNNESLWQLSTATAGTVNTNAQAWVKALQAGAPKTYTAGEGINIAADGRITVKAGAGVIVDATGVRVDPAAVPQFRDLEVPAGNTIATITHGLGTRALIAEVYEAASGNTVLAGVTRSSDNAVTIEFAVAPAAGQYRCAIMARGA